MVTKWVREVEVQVLVCALRNDSKNNARVAAMSATSRKLRYQALLRAFHLFCDLGIRKLPPTELLARVLSYLSDLQWQQTNK